MRECRCPEPNPKPQKPTACVRCGCLLAPRWLSSDSNLDAFLNRLNSCQSLPITIAEFEALCERRERAGRDSFRCRYLARDNVAEAAEELADALIYMYLDQLKAERDGAEEASDLAFTVAYYVAKAYDALAQMQAKRHHAP